MWYLMLAFAILLLGCDNADELRAPLDGGAETADGAPGADADPSLPDAAAGQPDALVTSLCDGTWMVDYLATDQGVCPDLTGTYLKRTVTVKGSTITSPGYKVEKTAIQVYEPDGCAWSGTISGQGPYTIETLQAFGDSKSNKIAGYAWIYGDATTGNCKHWARVYGTRAP